MLAIGGTMKNSKTIGRCEEEGFSLVELTVAMFILAVGVLGGMVMILMGLTRDNTNRVDTTATNAAQAVLEGIAAVPPNSNLAFTVTDCKANNLPFNTTASNSPGTGAPLQDNGDIDCTQAPMPGPPSK